MGNEVQAERKPKRGRGRPRKYPWAEKIDATPVEIAEKVLQVKPPKQWNYLEQVKHASD